MTEISLSIVRRLKASPARVFEAFTRADLIARWWGPDAGQALHAQSDLRVGGDLRVVFETRDGQRHESVCVYREIVADRRLVFSMAWAATPERVSLVTVTFDPIADGTKLTILQERFADTEARDLHMAGWRGTLEKFQTLLEVAVAP